LLAWPKLPFELRPRSLGSFEELSAEPDS